MKFSIGIPAFKASYLKECISSVLNQTFTEFELIIVNDASPEDIDSVVNYFSDPRIKYSTNDKNKGAEHVVDNWNKCLTLSSGDFFLLMGDDDRLEPNFLQEFDILTKRFSDKDVYHCRSYIINEKSEKISLTPSWPEVESVYENIWHRLTEKREQFISDFLYRTVPLKKKGGYFKLPLAWGSDDLSAYMMSIENGIAHTNTPVFNYRRTAITISSNGNFKMKQKAFELEMDWLHDFLKFKPSNPNDILFRKLTLDYLDKYFVKKSTYALSDYYSKKSILNTLGVFNQKEFSVKIRLFAFAKIIVSKLS